MSRDQAIQKLAEVARRKHLSLATEESYCGWLARFCEFVAEHPEIALREAKVEAFLTQLAKAGCAASTQNQAFSAILFFYRNCLNLELGRVVRFSYHLNPASIPGWSECYGPDAGLAACIGIELDPR